MNASQHALSGAATRSSRASRACAPACPAIAAARRGGRDVRRAGLPTSRDEAWHYTSLRALADDEFREALTSVDGGALPAARASTRRAWCSWTAASATTCPAARSLPSRAFADEPASAPCPPGAAAGGRAEHDAGRRRRGCRVAAGVDAGTLLLVNLAAETDGRSVAFHPRHAIRLAAGARLTVIEMSLGRGRYLHNPVTEIEVAAGATLTHVRLQDESPDAFHLATIYADIARARDLRRLHPDARRPAVARRVPRPAARPERDRAPERGAAAGRRPGRRRHHRGRARRAELRRAPDGEERADRPVARRVPGPHRGRPGRAEDRRLPDEPGAAAVARTPRSTASRSCRSTPTT